MPTIYVLSRNMKNISFLSENFQFLEGKFSIYLNMRVSVMIVLAHVNGGMYQANNTTLSKLRLSLFKYS